MKKITLISLSLLSVFLAQGQTDVPTVISASATWTAAKSPYMIQANTIIQADAMVTIQPGVRVISTGNYVLAVNGGLRALGKADSLISFESLTLDFGTGAMEYEPATGAGSHFEHTRFLAFSSSGHNINIKGIDLAFDHCLFDFGYYNIYNSSNVSTRIWITNSKFKYTNGGYPVYGLYEDSYLYLVGNSFNKVGYIYLAGENVIKNNYILGINYSYAFYGQYYTWKADIECNHVRKTNYGLYFSGNSNSFQSLNVRNNQFDSCNYLFTFSCSNIRLDSVHIRNNNFKNITNALTFSGCSGSGSFNMFDIGDNFWFTTDTTKILGKITDFRKNALVPWKADVGEVRTESVTPCWPLNIDSAAGVFHFLKTQTALSLFPNPARELVHIQVTNPAYYHVVVFDFLGKISAEFYFKGDRTTMNIKPWRSGIYTVCVTEPSGSKAYRKLVVE